MTTLRLNPEKDDLLFQCKDLLARDAFVATADSEEHSESSGERVPRSKLSGRQYVILLFGNTADGSSVTLTIPANASVPFPVGTVFVVINVNASALSIAITSDTLTLVNSTTTGTRTLAQNGVATCIKIGATSWLISGAGLT